MLESKTWSHGCANYYLVVLSLRASEFAGLTLVSLISLRPCQGRLGPPPDILSPGLSNDIHAEG